MRRHRRPGLWFSGPAALLAAAACAGPCPRYAEQTGAALSRAREAGAEAYAPALYSRARDLAARADGECRRQESRWPGFRSYRAAGDLHARAREEADRAASAAGTNRGILRQEALNARYRAGMMLQEARLALGNRSGSPGHGADDPVQTGLAKLERELHAIDIVLRGGEFAGVRDRCEAVSQEAVRLEGLARRPSSARR